MINQKPFSFHYFGVIINKYMEGDKNIQGKRGQLKTIELLEDIKNRLFGLKREAKENMEEYINEKAKKEQL